MRPSREEFENRRAAYFVSTQTAQRRSLFHNEPWARLMQETLVHYAGSGYELHAYVIMPNHLHVLLTPVESLEKAVQLFKGGFSYRAKKMFEWQFEVWQQGFSDHRIRDAEDWARHLGYIRRNPVNAGLVVEGGEYPYMAFPKPDFPQGLKP